MSVKTKYVIFGILIGIILSITVFIFIQFTLNRSSSIGEMISARSHVNCDYDDCYLEILLEFELKNFSRINQIEFISMDNRISSSLGEIVIKHKRHGGNTLSIEVKVHPDNSGEPIYQLSEHSYILVIHEGFFNPIVTYIRVDPSIF